MRPQTARKFGLFTALSMVVGIVVGIGVFFKNGPILRSQALAGGTSFSFWSLIATWVVSAVIVLCSALSFAQISTCRTSKSGLAGWAEQLSNRKVGRFVKYSHCVFYLGILCSTFPFLSVEGLVAAFGYGIYGDPAQIHFGYVFLGGMVLIAGVFALNFFSARASARFQNVFACVKFVPILAVIVAGLMGLNRSHVPNADAATLSASPIAGMYGQGYLVPDMGSFSVDGLFVALPMAFFTFDSYANVGNIAPLVRRPERNVPVALVAGIAFSAAIYILIAVGSGLTGFGSADQIISSLVPDGAGAEATRRGLTVAVNVFVTVSALSVSNGMISALLKSCSGIVEAGEIMGWRTYERLNGRRVGTGDLCLALLACMPLSLVLGTVGTATNNDSVIGSMTNFPTLFFMMVYAFVTVLAMVDARTRRQCRPVRGFWFAAPIAVAGTLIAFGYFFFYQYLYHAAVASTEQNDAAGLFFGNAAGVSQGKWLFVHDAALFWLSLAAFWTMPFVNALAVAKTGGGRPAASCEGGAAAAAAVPAPTGAAAPADGRAP